MEKKKVYVPVDVNEELPTDSKSIFALYNVEFEPYQKEVLSFHPSTSRFQNSNEGYSQGLRHPDFWLKEQELYVFTKEELEAQTRSIIAEAIKIGLAGYSNSSITGQAMIAQIISSLNLK